MACEELTELLTLSTKIIADSKINQSSLTTHEAWQKFISLSHKLAEEGLYDHLNWNNRALNEAVFKTRNIPKLEPSEIVSYQPKKDVLTTQDKQVYYDLIARIEAQRTVFPQCPRLIKMLKFLRVHCLCSRD